MQYMSPSVESPLDVVSSGVGSIKFLVVRCHVTYHVTGHVINFNDRDLS